MVILVSLEARLVSRLVYSLHLNTSVLDCKALAVIGKIYLGLYEGKGLYETCVRKELT